MNTPATSLWVFCFSCWVGMNVALWDLVLSNCGETVPTVTQVIRFGLWQTSWFAPAVGAAIFHLVFGNVITPGN